MTPADRDLAADDGDQIAVVPWLHSLADQNASATSGSAVIPVAFAGRVSDKDNQDPTLSIPRQLGRCRAALPDGFVVVAHFYDVESGRMDIDHRGHGRAHEEFDIPVPRDGGVADLLAEAKRADRRFVAVVCESVDRLARITYFGTKIEYELEQAGVALLAADEGIAADAVAGASAGVRRKRATPILTRRVKQAISEWYVVNMLELSWDGLVTHTDQGWNIGKPPYGYLAEVHRHPVKAKADDGLVKRRLVPDPDRGPVVTQIFTWRATEQLSYDAIAARLNLDPDCYPPPQPIAGRGRRAVGRWTPGAVREILCNPKYTGYMVWNRRKRSRPERGVAGGVNPPTEWVWSSRPTHEPLTTRRLFDAATPIGRLTRGSRAGAAPNRHPATKRTYRLRSYVVCELCGRRMCGKTRRAGDVYSYYACEPQPVHHAQHDWFATHPKSLWVREDKLLAAVNEFFARRVFGPDRRILLAQGRDGGHQPDRRAARAHALQSKVNEIDRQQANLVAELQRFQSTGDDDVDRQWRAQLRDSFAKLANQRKAVQDDLAAATSVTTDTDLGDPDLLDRLPVLRADLADLPEELQRELFDCFQLQIRYHHPTRQLTLRVTINGEVLDRLTAASHMAAKLAIAAGHLNSTKTPPAGKAAGGDGFSLAASAPDRGSFEP